MARKKTQPKGPLTSSDPKIQAALNKAKELQKKKLPETKDILKQDKEFKKTKGKLRRILSNQWFLNLTKKKSSKYIKK